MNFRRKLLKKYIYADRLIILLLIFSLVFFANFVHNSQVANESRGRDFSYNAWQVLTKKSTLFSSVKTRDVFVSANQNDAFETNAGSFYWNTGIRLAYIFNVVIIWPQYSKCSQVGSCPLKDVRNTIIRTMPNLQRGAFVPVGRNIKLAEDWVNVNSKPGALKNSRLWWFDIFLMTPKTMIAFLAPFDETAGTASVKYRDLRLVTISKADKQEFTPAISNVCLVRDREAGASVRSGGLTLNYWKVPEKGHSPDKKPIEIPSSVDIRGLAAGAC